MPIEFRIDWGYQLLYSRRHYHPALCWDGRLECRGGTILSVHQLDYPVNWFGPCQSARAHRLPAPEWRSTTRRGLAGIRVTAECDVPRAVFTAHTAQGVFSFTAEQIQRQGRIAFAVGPKYGHAAMLVTREGFYWFRPPPRPGECMVESAQFRGGHPVDWARMDQVWIDPGTEIAFDVDLAEPGSEGEHTWLFRLQAMTAGAYVERKPKDWTGWKSGMTPVTFQSGGRGANGRETQARDYMPMELWHDGRCIAARRVYLRDHDPGVQLLQDIWIPVPLDALAPGLRRVRLRNVHPGLPLLVHRITVRPRTRRHLALHVPAWARVGRPFRLGVEVVGGPADLRLDADPALWAPAGPTEIRGAAPGRCEFSLSPRRPLRNIPLAVEDLRTGQRSEAVLEAAYAMPGEEPEVQVGFNMTTVPHDDTGEMDFILDYTHRTQLGNLVVFRPFTPPTDGSNYARWGRFCREHGIRVMAIKGYQDGQLIAAAGPCMAGLGAHELSFQTYAVDPDDQSRTMLEAADRYMAFLRENIEAHKPFGVPISFGDAGGGHAFSLRAGADFLRAETMVAHTTLHCSQARGAATSVGTGRWGVHIALQHAKQPYLASHLDQFFLSLAQPWMMGAQFLYEEDSLFQLMKEERQAWDDALTRGKRRILRDFYRFAATHPRPGRPEIPLAVVQGRGAAPFNGFICGPEQDPSYSVWGRFGRTDPAWGHAQPEKAYQVLDVLMPGASTHPLRQIHERRRFYYSGSPFGDFDQVPIEATAEILGGYRLLLLLGWNTMNEASHEKLVRAVETGATLLLGVPQLSTHETRDFLADLHDLALFRGGDARTLCGVRIQGRGERYSGAWTRVGREFAEAACPILSRAPSVSPDEDGPCRLAEVELCGAEAVLLDERSGKPLLVRRRIGKGTVYLFTTWAYPGHEALADPAGAVVAELAKRHRGAWHVADPENEIFWTRRIRPDGTGTLYLLNTDWTGASPCRTAEIRAPWGGFPVEVRQGEIGIVTCLPGGAWVQSAPQPHVDVKSVRGNEAALRVHGAGPCRFRWQGREPSRFRVAATNGTLRTRRNEEAWDIAVDGKTQTAVDVHLTW